MKCHKNYYLIVLTIFILLLTPYSYTQSINSIDMLDSDYLSSLPESVRKDIENEIKKSNESDDNSFKKRPSSELSKYEVVKEWERFQKQRYKELYKSERFGISLFRSMQSSFMPINEPNFGNNYILDYGDVITINLFGNINETFKLEIERNGSINIPELGPISLAGLNFQQGVENIKNRIQSSYIGTEVDIKLSKIRDIKVLVTGNVEFPGIYTLSGNSNVLQALNISGGVDEAGTLRNIEIKRNGNVIKTVDLYQALIFGDLSQITQLQSGDAIYVKPANKLIRAGSGFINEALYELKNDENLEDLLAFSGGIKKEVFNKTFSLISINGDINENIKLNTSDNFITLNHLDSIYFPVMNLGTVQITGEVARPGKYTIKSGDSLNDLIIRAGGYSLEAYSLGGVLKREEVKELELKYTEKVYRNIISYLAQNPDQLRTNSQLGFILEEFKNIQPSGRLVAEFDLLKLTKDPTKNIFLEDRDEIHIPKLSNVVYVYGDVGDPKALSFKDFDNVSDYLSKAGGLNKTANKKHILVISPNGESKVVNMNKFSSILKNDIDIYPGTLIYAPQEIGIVEGIEFYSIVAPIFSSLALSLASLNAISD